jgi:hypothetical protein
MENKSHPRLTMHLVLSILSIYRPFLLILSNTVILSVGGEVFSFAFVLTRSLFKII